MQMTLDKGPTRVDMVDNVPGHRSNLEKLLAYNMDPACLRDDVVKNGVLREDAWKAMDEKVLQIASDPTTVVDAFRSRGLTVTTNGLAKTVLRYEDVSDMNDAELSIAAEAEPAGDRVAYSTKGMPLPLCHKGFHINARAQAESNALGDPLDTTQVAIATRKVIEKNEKVACQGASSLAFGGYTLYGMEDFSSVVTGNVTAAWGDSSADEYQDIMNAIQALRDVHHFGPYGVFVSGNWAEVLNENYGDAVTTQPLTKYERIMKHKQVAFVEVGEFMTDSRLIVVSLKEETFQIVIGLDIQVVEWVTMGGLRSHYLVWDIVLPRPRADQAGNCGIAVYS